MHKTYEAMMLCDILQLLRRNTKMTTQVYIYSPTEATEMGEEGGPETAEEEVVCKSCLSFTPTFIRKRAGE